MKWIYTHYSKIIVELIETGVPGLDRMLAGGVPKGAVVVTVGASGSGKTILNMQIAGSCLKKGMKVSMLSSQYAEDYIKYAEMLGLEFKKYIEKGKLKISGIKVTDIGSTLKNIEETIKESMAWGATAIVIDSISSFEQVSDYSFTLKIFYASLIPFVKKEGVTLFMLKELSDFKSLEKELTFSSIIDVIIMLYHVIIGNKREWAVEVYKLRGRPHDKQLRPFKITDKGIKIFADETFFKGER